MTPPWASALLKLRSAIFQQRPHPLFDATWYRANNPDVVAAGVDPYRHYVTNGRHEGRWPNAHFDPVYYSQQSGSALSDTLDHYWLYGAALGYDPHPIFDTNWYTRAYPDVANAGLNPLQHFMLHGRLEGRHTQPSWRTLTVGPRKNNGLLICGLGTFILQTPINHPKEGTFYPEYAIIFSLTPTQSAFLRQHFDMALATFPTRIKLILSTTDECAIEPGDQMFCLLMRSVHVWQASEYSHFYYSEVLLFTLVDDCAQFVASSLGVTTGITWRSGSPDRNWRL